VPAVAGSVPSGPDWVYGVKYRVVAQKHTELRD
jgi:hypothetical protein